MLNTHCGTDSRFKRLVVSTGATLAAILAAVACSSQAPSSQAQPGTDSNFNATAGVPAGSAGAAGAGGSSNHAGSPAVGGAPVAGSKGVDDGAAGSVQKQCVDVEPPFDPKWPDANCQKWAKETNECGSDWFAAYCDVSCGRCVPESNGGGGGGGAGTGGSSAVAGSSSGGGDAGGAPSVNCSAQGLPNVTSGNGYATRYWDCCQTHCGQYDGHRCGQDGTTRTGDNNSACSGGGSFACYDEAPKAVSDCLSYGYVAKANPNCGQCYRIQFTGEGQYNPSDPGSVAIKGKQMIVKVSNTGGDVGANQFDLMIPGGGVGQFNACSNQWGTSDLGAQYGGFLTNCKGSHAERKACVRDQCTKVPAGAAREGCLWFVDWFQAADNPKFTSEQTDCPF